MRQARTTFRRCARFNGLPNDGAEGRKLNWRRCRTILGPRPDWLQRLKYCGVISGAACQCLWVAAFRVQNRGDAA